MTKFEMLVSVMQNNPSLIREIPLELGVEINTIDDCGYISVKDGFIKLDRMNEKISFIPFEIITDESII